MKPRLTPDTVSCVCHGCKDEHVLNRKELEYMLASYHGTYCDECKDDMDRKEFYGCRDEYGYDRS